MERTARCRRRHGLPRLALLHSCKLARKHEHHTLPVAAQKHCAKRDCSYEEVESRLNLDTLRIHAHSPDFPLFTLNNLSHAIPSGALTTDSACILLQPPPVSLKCRRSLPGHWWSRDSAACMHSHACRRTSSTDTYDSGLHRGHAGSRVGVRTDQGIHRQTQVVQAAGIYSGTRTGVWTTTQTSLLSLSNRRPGEEVGDMGERGCVVACEVHVSRHRGNGYQVESAGAFDIRGRSHGAAVQTYKKHD